MKTRLLLFAIVLITCFILADGINNKAHTYVSGAPAGYTGSPGDGGTCNSCHSSAVGTRTGLITTDIPGSGYIPNTTYNIAATITQAGINKYGFEVSPQNSSGTIMGSLVLTNTTETRLVGTGGYITHTSNGVSGSGTKTWTFKWTAPASNQGPVTFYGAFNMSNADGTSNGDNIVTSSTTVNAGSVPPTANFTVNKSSICATEAAVFTNTSTGNITSYQWNFGAGASPATANTVGPHSVIYSSSGNKTVSLTVNGPNGSNTETKTNVVNVNSVIAITLTPKAVSCHGGSDGAITSTISGGSGVYNYKWSNNSTTANISNLALGNYTITVTDNSGCSNSAMAIVNEPPAISFNVAATNATVPGACDGSIKATAGGGTPPYSFKLNPGGQTNGTGQFNSLCEGDYTVTLTDANGCTRNLPVTVRSNGPIVIAAAVTQPSCSNKCDGVIQLDPSGGAGVPYTCKWSAPAGNTDTGADSLCAGNYSVTVTDKAGNTALYTTTLVAPAPITVNHTFQNASCGTCKDGSACASATGGTAPYTYTWSNGKTTACTDSLLKGNYTVTITDDKGCTASKIITIGTSSVSKLSVKNITVKNESDSAKCDGTLTIAMTGGLRPYQYTWSPITSTDSSLVSLCGGLYCVHITDKAGQAIDTCLKVITNQSNAINDMSSNFHVNIAPNPFSDVALVSLSMPANSTMTTFKLFNSFGQCVKTIDCSGLQSFYLHCEELAAGIYHFVLLHKQAPVKQGSLILVR